MNIGVNKVTLIGNAGANPEIRYTANQSAVVSLSIATSESYKDKVNNKDIVKTEWHKVVLFNRLAEIAKNYVKKGSKIYIDGRIATRKWQDKNGVDRYTTEIIANEMQLLNSVGSADKNNENKNDKENNSQDAFYSELMKVENEFAPEATPISCSATNKNDFFDDGIPF